MEQSGISTEVLLMEEHLETMDLFLTDGGRAQPIAVFLNANGDVLARWGARPAYIQVVMDLFRKNHPDKHASDYQENIKRVFGFCGGISNYSHSLILHKHSVLRRHL
jgi:Thioredoxin